MEVTAQRDESPPTVERPAGASAETALIETVELTVKYGGRVALDSFNFRAKPGEVTAVIGPNGSGKTTFLNAVTGLVPSSGRIEVRGKPVRGGPRAMFRAGIARTFQNLDLIDDLSTEENVALGVVARHRSTLVESLVSAPRSVREHRERRERARELMDMLNIGHLASVKPRALAYGYRRRAEVARALASRPAAILLDEPTAGMGPAESGEFAALFRRVAAEMGASVIVVEHDMAVVRAAVDTVFVLSTGNLIAQGSPAEVLESDVVRQVYLGEAEAA
jgi:ABC-type branched-subunit amino acid transport system ATPase component